MNIKMRIARLEKATDDLPADDNNFDPTDFGQFLVEYVLMVESLPDYFAAEDRRVEQQIAEYERRLEAKKDYPGVLQSLEGNNARMRRDLAIRAAFMDYWQAEQTGLDVAGALERLQAAGDQGINPGLDARGSPLYSHWIHSLHRPPRRKIEGYNVHCERVDQFWCQFWKTGNQPN